MRKCNRLDAGQAGAGGGTADRGTRDGLSGEVTLQVRKKKGQVTKKRYSKCKALNMKTQSQ